MIFKCGMVNPIIRKIVIDEKLLLKAKGLLRNFPQISGKYEEDIRQYRKNKEIINELSYEYNLPNDSTGQMIQQVLIKANINLEKFS